MSETIPLIGRGSQTQALTSLLDCAARGQGAAALITADPGMGKSHLVRAIVSRAATIGLQVREARCEQLEVSETLAAPLRAFSRNSDWVRRASRARTLFEAGATASAGAFVRDQLLEFLEADCSRRPVLLALEDLHWADLATLTWLRQVLDRAVDLRLLVLLTSRPPLPGTDLRRALDSLSVERIPLGPLSADEACLLARAVADREPSQDVLTAIGRAGGNPLLVKAIVEAMAAGAGFPEDGITAQVRELGRSALKILQVAAVLGTDIDPAVLASVAGKRAHVVSGNLEEAVTSGIVTPGANGYSFRHELYREAVLAELTPAEHSGLRLASAKMLATVGASTLAIAEQYMRGADAGDRQAVSWLHFAAEQIVATSPEAALRLCDVAESAAGNDPPPALLVTRMRALAGVGRAAEAQTLGKRILANSLPVPIAARLHRELAFTAFMLGRPDLSVDHMERCAALTGDPAARARVHGEIAFAKFLVIDHSGATASAESAVVEGRLAGDVPAQVAGGAVLGFLDLFAARFADAARRAHEIVTLAESPESGDAHVFQPWFIAAVIWLESDRFDLVASSSRAGRERALIHGSAWASPAYDAVTAFSDLRQGNLDDAAACAVAALSYESDVDGFGIAVWCNAFLAQVALHAGDESEAERYIAQGFRCLARGRAQLGFEQLCLASAELHERRGDLETACALLGDVWDLFIANGVRSSLPGFGAPLARIAATLGDGRRLIEVSDVLACVADLAATARTRAVANLAAAWRNRDVEHAIAAAELVSQTRLRPLAATAYGAAAAIAAERGRVRDADRLAGEAAGRWAALGADADARICAAAGSRGRPPVLRPRFGVDALTGAERRVVRLLADGKANADIAEQLGVSRRTVESHVSAAYRKLGVTSRVAMARIVMERRIGA